MVSFAAALGRARSRVLPFAETLAWAGISIGCQHGHTACTAREESAGSTSAV